MALFGKKKSEQKLPANDPVPPAETAPVRQAVLPQGEDASAYQAILHPYLTEKASQLVTAGHYVFKVRNTANKIQIKLAVEKLYKVEVKKIALVTLPAKTRRIGRFVGVKPGFKKAIVTLRPGFKIDII